jgi:hypothetical protein
MTTVDVMEIWRKMPLKTYFTIDGEVFQKNSPSTALHVSNPIFGELYIGPIQARAIKPYAPPTAGPAVQEPKDPEHFEIKQTEPDPDAPKMSPMEKVMKSATTVTVTPVNGKVEQGIQPPPGTGKRVKKAEKTAQAPKPAAENSPKEE